MKKLITASGLALTTFAGSAGAATYNVDVTASTVLAFPGTLTKAVVTDPSGPQDFAGASDTIELTNIGDVDTSVTFGLVSWESVLDAEDLSPLPVFTSFDIGGLGIVSVLGSFAAASDFSSVIATFGFGRVTVDALSQILVTIAPVTFATDGSSYITGRGGYKDVEVTFSLVPIPLPATLPLAILGLAGLGFAARRRRSVKNA